MPLVLYFVCQATNSVWASVFINIFIRIAGFLIVTLEKTKLLFSNITYETADVISTYVYRKNLEDQAAQNPPPIYSISFLAIGIVLLCLLFYLFYKKKNK